MPPCGVVRRRAPSIELVTTPSNVIGSMPAFFVLLRAETSSKRPPKEARPRFCAKVADQFA